jgi:FkbM family methyltransferase
MSSSTYQHLRRIVRDGVRTAVASAEVLTRYRSTAKLARAGGHLVADVRTPGGALYVHLLDLGVGRPLYTGLQYEPEESTFLERSLKPGMTVIDVGANVGYMALLAAKTVGAGGTVIAIEPDPGNAELLTANVERNGYRNVLIQRCAVGSEPGTAQLYRSAWNMGNHRLNPGAGGQAIAHEAIAVPVRTVDAIVADNRLSRVDVIKMDVEGYEPGVLGGMTSTLARFKPVILTEFWPYGMRDAGFDPEGFLDRCIRAGYEGRTLASPDRRLKTVSDILATLPNQDRGTYDNIVLVPSGATPV